MSRAKRTRWRTSIPISKRSDPARLSDAAELRLDGPAELLRAGVMATRLPLEQEFGVRVPGPQPPSCPSSRDDGWKTALMRGFSDHRCCVALATLIRSVWGRCAYLSLGAAVGAIVLAGCGDSSSAPVTGASGASGVSGPGGAGALTKAEFIDQADAVCAEANTAIADLTGGATTGNESLQVSQELEIVRSELQSIQALQ